MTFTLSPFLILFQNNGLPFENNEVTIEKVMAGIFVTAIYFIPTIIARDKKNLKYIFIGNLLTGWTGVGWLLALLWAIRSESNPNLIVPKKKKKQKNEIQNID